MADPDPAKKSTKVETNPYSLMAARFWHGMTLKPQRELFKVGKFRNVGPLQAPMVGSTLFTGVINSGLAAYQDWRYAKQIDATEITEPPIFIIGHWRSGTTLLHEFLALDPRHTFPTNYECFVPAHCLTTNGYITKLKFLLPSKRPMDNMDVSWERPQEDEFALMAMGLPSPYRNIAFPNNAPVDLEYLDFQGVSDADRARWQAGLRRFLKMITFVRPGKAIVLKTPQHLGRVRVLQEAFPTARFIHIVRDPYKVFPSTIKLWKSLYKIQAFQTPKHEGLENYVFTCFERMYTQFEKDRAGLDPSRFCELRYEDLVTDPHREIEQIYERLQLGDVSHVSGKVDEYLKTNKDYQTNKFELDESLRQRIDERWGHWMRPYGYCGEAKNATEASVLAKSFLPNR